MGMCHFCKYISADVHFTSAKILYFRMLWPATVLVFPLFPNLCDLLKRGRHLTPMSYQHLIFTVVTPRIFPPRFNPGVPLSLSPEVLFVKNF
jgi:hypothetical protein